MSVLSDSIELFIKEMMGQSDEVSLQRNELAQHFSCAPSQINYVLSTRFDVDHGYVIVSRRGGGGCIRVMRVDLEDNDLLYELVKNRIGGSITKREALAIISRLEADETVTSREAALMQAAVSGCALPTEELSAAARANVLKTMLLALLNGNRR
ncbi:MAG: CtsR family transcriptional regulator [Eubacteriales bacterium]|nr:CtsR family transcriptional regulator [Eubacteriales bacterium]